jgi:phage protein D
MSVSKFRVFINNEAANADQLDRFTDIQVDQAIGMASEAELKMDLIADSAGNWGDVDEPLADPQMRVRVEVMVGTGDFVPLIDGPVVSQRYDFSAGPGSSSITAFVQDDSVLLNQEEGVEVFENQRPDEIAGTLMLAAGLEVETDSVPDAGSSLERFVVRRGSAMRLLRQLARQNGMFVYVRPGGRPGKSVGMFVKPDLSPSNLPELLLMGGARNVNQITVEFDALRPMTASAGSMRISDLSLLRSEVSESNDIPLGDSPVHALLPPAKVLLARIREEQSDLDAAAQAAVNLSSWAYTARGETTADDYSGVLQPYKTIRLMGLGTRLSGDYLISHVKHSLNSKSYKQSFTLLRNARLQGSGASGLLGGVI